MKTLILAAGAVALAAAAANAQTVIREQETGVYSAPVAGATPQARENPSPGTTVLERRDATTVVEPRTRVIEQRSGGSTAVEVETRRPN